MRLATVLLSEDPGLGDGAMDDAATDIRDVLLFLYKSYKREVCPGGFVRAPAWRRRRTPASASLKRRGLCSRRGYQDNVVKRSVSGGARSRILLPWLTSGCPPPRSKDSPAMGDIWPSTSTFDGFCF